MIRLGKDIVIVSLLNYKDLDTIPTVKVMPTHTGETVYRWR